ncbi:lipocalin family protein [Tengunoibacter tsumagoiensis]|uniref:Carotenoid 1,2-hydratase n=1 Tax=Tengunoibacter tsumagoiensis TaxID=2014871 RepID=A0A401ZYD2_9CHLR|nr:lipocalin family protein [Tengunoibacter tsumagoiensis]GCE11851.1 carotenoid 1,2-hydratase [Tengunoibacter tsumagoiensis]
MRTFHRAHAWLISLCLFLTLGLSSCSFPGIVSTSEQLPEVKATTTPAQLPPIHFPQDEGGHGNLTEWWYYTGHLDAVDATGKTAHYGFEFVIFQALRGDLPPYYASHFAISDLNRNEFHYDQRRIAALSKALPDGRSVNGIDEQVGDWQIHGLNGQDQLKATMQDYAINLTLTGQKPVVQHNGNGLITYGTGGFSYYYSRSRMAIAGTLQDHQQTLQITGGIAWMDHQWGDFLATGIGGWDWYSLQLTNNVELMLYFIHDATGKVISTYAEYIDPASQGIVLPEEALHSTALDHWTSPKTGITYPSGWRLELNDSHVKGSLLIQPLLKDQELVALASTGNVYWEGAVDIQGQLNAQAVSGQGYIELTGYSK